MALTGLSIHQFIYDEREMDFFYIANIGVYFERIKVKFELL